MKKTLMMCTLMAAAVTAQANLLVNADFAATPPETNWSMFLGAPVFAPAAVTDYVSFSGSVATFSGNNTGLETNFYQGFGGDELNAALPAGVTYTFSADISNIVLESGATAVAFVKAFGPGYAWIGGEFQNPALSEGTNTITFTTTGTGDNIYQVGWYIVGAAGGSSMQITNPSLTVVPEPATYALVLGGLGLAVVMWRRRKQA